MADILDWDSIVSDLGPRPYRHFCVRFSEEQADDLTQETLIRLAQKVEAGSFSPLKGSLQMYAFGIAHYIALENSKAVKEVSIEEVDKTFDGLPSLVPSMEDWITQKNDVAFLRDQIKKLSAIEQQVLALFVDEELALEEIAGILQCPLGTVKSHVHRAKQKLTALFSKEYAK